MFNPSPQQKLNQQVASNTKGTDSFSGKPTQLESGANIPKGAGPKVGVPSPNTGKADKGGFTEWLKSKVQAAADGIDREWEDLKTSAKEKVKETIKDNLPGAPSRKQPKGPGPIANTPTHPRPQPPKRPQPKIPKFK
jgi:hypothetical protein